MDGAGGELKFSRLGESGAAGSEVVENFSEYERIAVRKYFKHIFAGVGGGGCVGAKCGVVDGVPESVAVYAIRHFSRGWLAPKQKNFAREF